MTLTEDEAKVKISTLRLKLDSVVESGDLYGNEILEISREMDKLVVEYYKKNLNIFSNRKKVAK